METKTTEQHGAGNKRWRPVIIILAAGVIALGAVLLWQWGREPEYQRKTLSYWLAKSQNYQSEEEGRQAREAVQQIGTNALPLLLSWLQHEPWPERHAWGLLRWSPPVVRDSSAVRQLVARGWEHNKKAMIGFRLLGSNASPAISELVTLVNQAPPGVAVGALRALGEIGEPAYPFLETVVTNTRRVEMRQHAIGVLRISNNLGSNTVPAILLLAQAANDTNAGVAVTAIEALRMFPQHAELAVPALSKCLASSNRGLRLAATSSLTAYGSKAKGAVTALESELNDPDASVRRAATSALKEIAPEVVTPAERF